MRHMMRFVVFVLSIVSLQAQKAGEWRYYSSDIHASKYSPLDQINKDNVAKLRIAWRHPQVDSALTAANPQLRLSNRYMATPIMVGGVLYISNGVGLVEAIDPATGKTLWTQKPLVAGPEGLTPGNILKGVAEVLKVMAVESAFRRCW